MTDITVEVNTDLDLAIVRSSDFVTIIDTEKYPIAATVNQELVKNDVRAIRARNIAQRTKKKYRKEEQFTITDSYR